MRLRNYKKGLTLIEVVVSIAILGLIAASFLGMFSNGYITIFTMGNKSRALAKAQSVVDAACKAGRLNYSTELVGISSNAVSEADLHTYEAGKESKYLAEDVLINSVYYKKITVAVFYQGGKRYVEITSLIP